MKVCFSADQVYLNSLKTDVTTLKKMLKLPCEFEDVYNSITSLRRNALAATYYGKNEIAQQCPVIEFSMQYFTYNDSKRRIVLLHEMIHACQRFNDLSELNSQ